jgi:hypothetical protein
VRSPEIPALTCHQEEPFCPSGLCNEGAILLGIVGVDGIVGYITPQMTVDADFVHEARRGRTPEARFRFAQPCIKGQCGQWTGSRCGLIDRLLQSPEAKEIVEPFQGPLPKCTIRSSCRWFAQIGTKACALCPLIIHSRDGTVSPSAGSP